MTLLSTRWLDCGFVINFCVVYFGKGTQPFDFIKHNLIQKSVYKIKCIIQTDGGLIMFFGNWGIFFKISWLDYEHYVKNQYKKGTQST